MGVAISNPAWSFGIGEPDKEVNYGERLDFRIPVYSDADIEWLAVSRVQIAECHAIEQGKQLDCDSISLFPYQVELEHRGALHFVHVRSQKTVDDLALRVVLRFHDDQQSLVKGYNFIVNMPDLTQEVSAVASPVAQDVLAGTQSATSELVMDKPPIKTKPAKRKRITAHVVPVQPVSGGLSISSGDDEQNWPEPVSAVPDVQPLSRSAMSPQQPQAQSITDPEKKEQGVQYVEAAIVTRLTWAFGGIYLATILLFVGILIWMQRRTDALIAARFLNDVASEERASLNFS